MAEELLDVLDENCGAWTGARVSRKEAHDKGVCHAAVHTWLVDKKGNVLFQQRAECKDSYASMWDVSSAGHVKAGEFHLDTAAQEFAEELGAKISKDDIFRLGRFHQKFELVGRSGKKFINNEWVSVYLVVWNEIEPGWVQQLKLQESEVQAVKLYKLADIEKAYKEHDPIFVPASNPAWSQHFFRLVKVFLEEY